MSDAFSKPLIGEDIHPNDQGVYYAINRKTGGINNVFNLVFEDEDWYLYQLKNINKEGDVGWVILADQGDYPLKMIEPEEVDRYFSKPEYLEPKGAWKLMRNSRYGFGKFTPESKEMGIRYSMILFSGSEMLVPLLIEKARDEALKSLAEMGI
jgi:hypothetical protein